MHDRLMHLAVLLIATNAAAEAIRYEQIPADVTGYAHVDMERILSSRLIAHFTDPAKAIAQMESEFGGRLLSATIYSRVGGDSMARMVVLCHARGQKLFEQMEAKSAKARDAVTVDYGGQKIYFSSAGQFELLTDNTPATTNPSGEQEPESTPPKKRNNSTLWLGMGDGVDIKLWTQGPSYRAYVGQGMIVATTDLKSMADALDVLNGKKPSLATHDPGRLKSPPRQGVMIVGAGLTAGFTADNREEATTNPSWYQGPTTRPAAPANPTGFGLDLFGSFTGKAKLARFDLGEDQGTEYVNLSFAMADQASAEQLKNLVLGMTALISLSQVEQQPLIQPLLVQARGNDVELQWTWPTEKLDELARLVQGKNDDRRATRSSSASQPSR